MLQARTTHRCRSSPSRTLLEGRKGLVVGIANQHSIAYGCARMLRDCGAELGGDLAQREERGPTSSRWRASSARRSQMPLDVEQPGAMEAVFDAIRERWGRLDFVLHSIAFAPAERPARPRRRHARAKASRAPWTSRAIRSCAWRGSPSR